MDIDPANQLLIEGLLLRAGRIMEDFAPELARQLPDDPVELRARIKHLVNRTSALHALATAAHSLIDCGKH